jgi:Ca-activated chloride channel family protein
MSPVNREVTSSIPGARNLGSGGRLVASDGRTLPLRGLAIRGEAQGGLARTALRQRFVNPYAEPLRVTYLVPLPSDGALAGYAFQIGARRIVGEVDRIAAARERFEAALVDGHTAGLVEQQRANLFTLELGNVPPHTEIVAELTIDQPLGWLDPGLWEWRFPTVVAPRYLGADGRVADAEQVSVDISAGQLPIEADVALVIRDAPADGGAPESPSHDITVVPGMSGLEIRLRGAPDRDIVFRWPAAGAAPGVNLATSRPASGRLGADAAYGLLTITPPRPESRSSATPRDLILLIDASGSMSGEPLAKARALACALVESLLPADRLELIAFASQPRRWRRQAAPATDAARRDAIDWLTALQAEGSTEMRDAVVEALRPLRKDTQRQVVLITDGLIGFESEIIAAITRDLPAGSRLHAVGVGSSVNRALTAPAARAGRGVEAVIDLDEDVAPHVARLLARMLEPVLTEVKIAGSAVLGHAPGAVPDVYAGSPLRLALKLRPEGGDLHVEGLGPKGAWKADLDVQAVTAGEGQAAIASLYGREAVEDLELSRAAAMPVSDDEIVRIGLDFQIATRLTSWVAVSEEPTVDPRQPTRRERIPHALPYGMSVEGLGLRAAGPRVLEARLGLGGPSALVGRLLKGAFTGKSSFVTPIEFASASPGQTRRSFESRARRPRLRGRLVRRRDRELTVEVELDSDLDWAPDDAKVFWAGGTVVSAQIVEERTSERGLIAARRSLRLCVRLTADGPPDPPERITIRMGKRLVTVVFDRA